MNVSISWNGNHNIVNSARLPIIIKSLHSTLLIIRFTYLLLCWITDYFLSQLILCMRSQHTPSGASISEFIGEKPLPDTNVETSTECPSNGSIEMNQVCTNSIV